MNELISVILPVYNGEKYLKEAIESILNQTYTNFEFIIIDDGSKDSSLEIIKEYEKEDERIVAVSRENKGLIATLNEGIEKAKGKYIARMDQDDISLPNRFEEQLKIMENDKEIVVCGSWINVFGENRKEKISKYFQYDKEIKANLIMSCCFAHPSVMMRRDAFLDNNIWYDENFKNAEDYHLWTQLARVGKFYNIPKVLLNYRFLETSITRVADKNESQRKQVYTNIFAEALNLIDYKRTKEEIELSFIISHKDRIKTNKIDLNKLKVYFDKIVQANQKNKFVDGFTLYKMLGNRWLLNFIVHRNIEAIFSKYFLYGIISVIK
ncbi:glycosyltransferase [Aliarcobacter butzleri]|uniref:glycosyltransferase family 2 protein n=1 Tax=Aliarcobacter butzleri TaxID=28197 RepID=UPI001EDC0B01|nr:glycosyltransferase [Aliarcobacter butzleri]MCG3686180.1 glycosyltransferase [Aliarcobacter butzleri]